MLFVLVVVLGSGTAAYAAPDQLNVNIDGIGSISAPLQLVVVLTLLSFVPAALVIMTCFTRIVIVFHFLRQALGTQEMPSNQILIGLTLFLTMFIMAPVAEQMNTVAVQPAIDGRMTVDAGDSTRVRRRCAISCSSRRAKRTSRCSWSLAIFRARHHPTSCRCAR